MNNVSLSEGSVDEPICIEPNDDLNEMFPPEELLESSDGSDASVVGSVEEEVGDKEWVLAIVDCKTVHCCFCSLALGPSGA